MPACSRIFDLAPSAPTKRRAEIFSPSSSATSIVFAKFSKPVTEPARSVTPTSFAFVTSASIRWRFSTMCAKGSPGSTSPPNVRNVGRTTSSSLESVITMSSIGCASPATASHTPIASNSRRAAAAIAEARGSFDVSALSAGSTTVTVKASPRPSRSAIASASPAKPAPPTTRSVLVCCFIAFGIAGFSGASL